VIRMFSGFVAFAIVGLLWLFRKRDGELSAYRFVLVGTIAMIVWGLWVGWVQWVVLGSGLSGGGFILCIGESLARLAMFSWVLGVLLMPVFFYDEDLVISLVVPPMLMLCIVGTFAQAGCVHGIFIMPEHAHRVEVSPEHCDDSFHVTVPVGELWTDWESVTCPQCDLSMPSEMVPDFTESQAAWDMCIQDKGGHGTQD